MNCDQAEELLGAYALGALEASEAASLRAHLVTCEEHRAKAAELRAVASSLHALAGPLPGGVAPPPALRGRIAAAVAPEDAGGVRAPVPAAERREARAAAHVQWRPVIALGALAAALAVAAGGLLAWNISLRGESSQAVTAVRPLQPEGGAPAGFVVLFEDGAARVVSDDMPALDATQSYQLWALTGAGEASSLGLMSRDDAGRSSADITFDAATTRRIAITIEPAGGSAQPTSAPIVVADLSS